MSFTRSQKIIVGVAGILLLLGIGIITGLLPGARKDQRLPEIKLTVWGILNENEAFRENLADYTTRNSNVRVDYQRIDPKNYESALVNALAAGKGPDILMFHSSWLPKHYDKINPVSNAQLNLPEFRRLFPLVAEQDFAPDGLIYALPLYIDTLTLFYNEDLFDSATIALPPTDWLDFQNLIPKLRRLDSNGNILTAAAAIGGSGQNIDAAADLLTLLMLQAGTIMTDQNFSRASFTDPVNGLAAGLDALNFYTKFSDRTNTYYTWQDFLESDLDSFAKGSTAMIFNYASQRKTILSKNPLLRMKAAPTPQPNAQAPAVNFANYWGLAVSNQSTAPDWAWDLILNLTAEETGAERFLVKTGNPPALRSLIQKYANDPSIGVFAKQALTARSWPRIDNQAIVGIFSETIQAVTSGRLDSSAALEQAESAVTELMRSKR